MGSWKREGGKQEGMGGSMVEHTHGRDSRSRLNPEGSIRKYTREENVKFLETTDQSQKKHQESFFFPNFTDLD